MGLCMSSELTAEERQAQQMETLRNVAIERNTAFDHDADTLIKKLLLLGAGESGKSTLFKQMVDIYGEGFTEKEISDYIPIVHNNTVLCIKTLCHQSDVMKESVGPEYGVLPENLESKNAMLAVDGDMMINPDIARLIKKLWADPGIQATYKRRSFYQLPDSAEYFFSNVDEYAKEGFRPTKQDILRTRVRTSGILETSFKIDDLKFRMFDVGGQRNERKKWIHCFENVTAVLFVAAISEYDQTLYEDDTTNRIQEALNLFEEICSSIYFRDTAIILFLNKKDLFAEKLKKVPLKDFFPDYDGTNEFEDAWRFLASKFLERRRDDSKQIYTHVTCATDDSNVTVVFNSVKDIVIRSGLMKSGLM